MEASLSNPPTASVRIQPAVSAGSATWPPCGKRRETVLVTYRVWRGQSPDPPLLLLQFVASLTLSANFKPQDSANFGHASHKGRTIEQDL